MVYYFVYYLTDGFPFLTPKNTLLGCWLERQARRRDRYRELPAIAEGVQKAVLRVAKNHQQHEEWPKEQASAEALKYRGGSSHRESCRQTHYAIPLY